jgi:hypothetical protein
MVRESNPTSTGARRFRTAVTADGLPGPIEERLGRRRLRVLDPDTAEGRRLLDEGRVEWIAPGGDALGRLTQAQALDALRRRLESRLADPTEDHERAALRDGLDRLRSRAERLGRA